MVPKQGVEHYLSLAYFLGSKIGSKSLLRSTKGRRSVGDGGRQRVFEGQAAQKVYPQLQDQHEGKEWPQMGQHSLIQACNWNYTTPPVPRKEHEETYKDSDKKGALPLTCH